MRGEPQTPGWCGQLAQRATRPGSLGLFQSPTREAGALAADVLPDTELLIGLNNDILAVHGLATRGSAASEAGQKHTHRPSPRHRAFRCGGSPGGWATWLCLDAGLHVAAIGKGLCCVGTKARPVCRRPPAYTRKDADGFRCEGSRSLASGRRLFFAAGAALRCCLFRRPGGWACTDAGLWESEIVAEAGVS